MVATIGTTIEDAELDVEQGYLNGLLPALERLDALLERAITAAQVIYGAETAADRFRGLYIDQDEVEQLLGREPGAPTLCPHWEAADESLPDAAISGSRLAWLKYAYGLAPFDTDVILMALAPELDRRYERLYAYLQDHVGRRRPSVDLALNLLCPDAAARLVRRAHFDPGAPLIYHKLLHLIPENDYQPPSLLSCRMKLDDQIVRFLLGQDSLDNRLTAFCRLVSPAAAEVAPADEVLTALSALLVEAWTGEQPGRLYFHGPQAAGKRQAAVNAAAVLERPVLIIDIVRALAGDLAFDDALLLALRYARFYRAIPYLESVETVAQPGRPVAYQQLLESLDSGLPIIILAGSEPWLSPGSEPDDVLSISFEMPDFARRRSGWQAHLGKVGYFLDENDINILAGRFRLWLVQIAQAVHTAAGQARWQVASGMRPAPAIPTLADFFAAARAQSGHDLASLARKIEPVYTWQDIVLPPAALEQLREICQRVIHHQRVLGEWGFGQRLALGKGVNALFAGPSGTGKTMAADIIANELGLELYKIDLSGVVSKYIGETEKNLDRVFRAAENANAILFFDEADALFGKRSEVRDSHDRYANIEISYLLQKMEEYDGLAILATNLRQNLDEAFIRRLAFTVHFPFPDEASRRQIWESVWPVGAPLAIDVDLAYLARQFKLSGGNIKNVALASAYLAAEDGQVIHMSHLVLAVRREYQKMSKNLTESELAPFQQESFTDGSVRQ